jgi:DNA-binding beta-propeller fold protein YncE
LAIVLTILATADQYTMAHDLIVSANDGKFVRVDGGATYPPHPPGDNLVVIDTGRAKPKIVAVIEGIEHTLRGPPQAVAIAPDGKTIVVGAPSRWDVDLNKEVFDDFLQVVDLSSAAPHAVARVDMGAHPNGLAINRQGSLLLAAALDGQVHIFNLEGAHLTGAGSIRLSDRRLGSVTFTHDGTAALVSLRDDGGVAVLQIDGDRVTDSGERISTGLAPYAIDVSADGRWAVVGNVGLNGLPGHEAVGSSDADSVALVDVSHRPFRTIQYLTVPSTPEAAAISPDGQWIVVQSMDGSNLSPSRLGHHSVGRVVLFRIKRGIAYRVNDLPSGAAAQGIVFAQDNKTVLVQLNVERAIAVFAIKRGCLVDTGRRLPVAGGPASIRAEPR